MPWAPHWLNLIGTQRGRVGRGSLVQSIETSLPEHSGDGDEEWKVLEGQAEDIHPKARQDATWAIEVTSAEK